MARWTGERVRRQKDEYQIFVMNILLLFWWQLYSNYISTYVLIFQSAHMLNNIVLFSISGSDSLSILMAISSPSVWRRRALCCWTEPAARRILTLTLKTYVRVSGHYIFNIFGAFLPSNSLFLWRNSPSIAQRPYSSSACSTVLHHRSAVWVGLPAAVWRRCKAPGMFKI